MGPPPEYQHAYQEAVQQLRIATHLLSVTYPLAKDLKLLLGVIDNLFRCVEFGIEAVLSYEYIHKTIETLPLQREEQFHQFVRESAMRNGFTPEQVTLVQEVQLLQLSRRASHTEFQRGSKYVFCSEEYRLRSVTAQQLKILVQQTSQFLTIVGQRIH